MVEFYEHPGYNKGSNTWKRNVKVLKELFGYDSGMWWVYSEKKFKWDLSPNEVYWLTQSVNCLSNACTGPVKKAITGLPRLGPFYHISLWFPAEHGDHRFLYNRKSLSLYKNIIADMLANLFPEYQIGYYFRVAYQANAYAHYPEMHGHIALSRIRYRIDDRRHLDAFKALPKGEPPYHSLFFHTEPITISEDGINELLEPIWRTAIKDATGREVTYPEPLVYTTGKEGQTILDRYDVLRYIANQHLHTFQNVESLRLLKDGKVRMEFKGDNGAPGTSINLSRPDFVRKYIIRPIQTFGVQFRGRGFLCGRAAFAKVGNAASQLVIKEPVSSLPEPHDPTSTFFYDLPVKDIQERAAEARECLEAGKRKRFNRIKEGYRLGDPMKELKLLKELRKAKRMEEQAAVKLPGKKWKSVDDEERNAL